MKIQIVILGGLIAVAASAGPINLRNEQALKDYHAGQAYRASTNYYSADQFAADIASAKNFAELQSALAKKAKAEQTEAKVKKDVKTGAAMKVEK